MTANDLAGQKMERKYEHQKLVKIKTPRGQYLGVTERNISTSLRNTNNLRLPFISFSVETSLRSLFTQA